MEELGAAAAQDLQNRRLRSRSQTGADGEPAAGVGRKQTEKQEQVMASPLSKSMRRLNDITPT